MRRKSRIQPLDLTLNPKGFGINSGFIKLWPTYCQAIIICFILLFLTFFSNYSIGQQKGSTSLKDSLPVANSKKNDAHKKSDVIVIDPHVGKNDTIILPAYIVNGDTLGHIWLANIDVVDKMIYHNEAERQDYLRLRRDVMVVLPYARYAGYRYKVLQFQLSKTTDPKQKRELIKALEKEIKQNYEKALTNLTITQGRILIKLIDRETGQTTYSIVKDLKSGFTAFIFQSVAGLFGDNLKDHYDPKEDKEIEVIIQSLGYY